MKKPTRPAEFVNTADELNYLSDVIQFYQSRIAKTNETLKPYLHRFEELLINCGTDDGSIVLQEHWALLYEVRNEHQKAISHREREISLIERALRIGGPVGPINEEFLITEMQKLVDNCLQLGQEDMAAEWTLRIQSIKAKGIMNE